MPFTRSDSDLYGSDKLEHLNVLTAWLKKILCSLMVQNVTKQIYFVSPSSYYGY